MNAVLPMPPRTDTSPLRVLLIEDDPAQAKLFRRSVRDLAESICICHVSDGESAIAAVMGSGDGHGIEREGGVGEGLVDLVLLDLRLPGVDGFEVLRLMRSIERLRRVPIVVVSTSDRREEIERCYRLGANAYLCKPPAYEDLTRHLLAVTRFWLDRGRILNSEF